MTSKSILFSKEVEALYKTMAIPLIATLFNTGVITFILFHQINLSILIAWFSVNIIIVLFRFWTYYRYHWSSKKIESTDLAYKYYLIGVVSSALVWGSSAYYLFPTSMTHAMILVFIIGGMVAGAISSSSYRPELYILYNVIVLSPYTIYFLTQHEDMYFIMGITLILFSIMLIISSRRFHLNFVESIMLQFQQQELLEHLKHEKLHTEELNQHLIKEMIDKEATQAHLLQALNEAEQAAKAKDAFFATMSHELRTPLNAVIGFSQILLKRTELPESLTTYMEKILLSGNRLLDLVNTILDFSKMRSGKIELHISSVALEDLFKELSIITEPLLYKKEIRLNYPKNCPNFIEADRKMLYQILLNLLSNAIKFSPPQSTITLSYELKEEHLFSVCDKGEGIASEHQQTIFDPFTQIKAISSEQQGTGLGLAIVKEMVQAHGGEIWVESTLGSGSCFYVALPCKS